MAELKVNIQASDMDEDFIVKKKIKNINRIINKKIEKSK